MGIHSTLVSHSKIHSLEQRNSSTDIGYSRPLACDESREMPLWSRCGSSEAAKGSPPGDSRPPEGEYDGGGLQGLLRNVAHLLSDAWLGYFRPTTEKDAAAPVEAQAPPSTGDPPQMGETEGRLHDMAAPAPSSPGQQTDKEGVAVLETVLEESAIELNEVSGKQSQQFIA
ncbi:hypothetical protein Btru_011588 [Bulinus truncatus]|nr:hypothetical protein Btru_011588 [Bulinus truncatus]